MLGRDILHVRPAARTSLLPATWLLVAATVGLAGIAGSGRFPSGSMGLPLALGAVGFLGLVLGEPWLGVSFLPFVADAVPFAIGTGTQSPVVAGLLFAVLLLGLWVVRAVLTHDFRVANSPVNLPVIAFIVVWILSYVASNATRPPLITIWPTFPLAQVAGLLIAILSAAVLILALNAVQDPRTVKIATWSVIFLGVLDALSFYTHLGFLSSFIFVSGLFAMWVITLAYGQALFNDDLRPWARAGLVVLVAALLVKGAIYETWWFSGWAPEIVVLIVLTFLRSRRLFIGVAMILAVLVAVRGTAMYDAVYGSYNHKGDASRFDIWGQQLRIIRQYPILGTGPAGYAPVNMSLYADSPFSMSNHNNYMDIIDETGIVGMSVWIWFLGTLTVVGWKARHRWRKGFYRGYCEGAFAGLIGAIVAMGLGDWVIPFVYNETIYAFRHSALTWVFLGFMAGLAGLRALPENASIVDQ